MNLEPLYVLIRRFEGLRLEPYICPAGVWTIGYGHTGRQVDKTTAPISADDAEVLMQADAARAVSSALVYSPILAAHEDKLCAIADFIFNLGVGRYRISTLKRHVDAGDWAAAGAQLGRWVIAGGIALPGLVVRRAAEAELLVGA